MGHLLSSSYSSASGYRFFTMFYGYVSTLMDAGMNGEQTTFLLSISLHCICFKKIYFAAAGSVSKLISFPNFAFNSTFSWSISLVISICIVEHNNKQTSTRIRSDAIAWMKNKNNNYKIDNHNNMDRLRNKSKTQNIHAQQGLVKRLFDKDAPFVLTSYPIAV